MWLYSEEDTFKLVHEEYNQCVISSFYQILGQAFGASVVLL
jgi:hypothetical protein